MAPEGVLAMFALQKFTEYVAANAHARIVLFTEYVGCKVYRDCRCEDCLPKINFPVIVEVIVIVAGVRCLMSDV